MVVTVPITDARTYPWCVITKRNGSGPRNGYELHFLAPDEAGSKADWQALAASLEASGAYELVIWATAGFQDEQTGQMFSA